MLKGQGHNEKDANRVSSEVHELAVRMTPGRSGCGKPVLCPQPLDAAEFAEIASDDD
jgi:hypothetical protein